VKPFKTWIQPFVTSGRVTPLFRVIFCFSSYFEVQAALRSLVVLGKEDHEESQIPDLWFESDLFSPSNFCSHCGDQSHSTLSCEAKSDKSYCGFCGSPSHEAPSCSRKATARQVFAALALRRLIETGYNEMTDFSPCLRAIVSHDETVPETWEIPLGDTLSGEALPSCLW